MSADFKYQFQKHTSYLLLNKLPKRKIVSFCRQNLELKLFFLFDCHQIEIFSLPFLFFPHNNRIKNDAFLKMIPPYCAIYCEKPSLRICHYFSIFFLHRLFISVTTLGVMETFKAWHFLSGQGKKLNLLYFLLCQQKQ